VGIKPSKYPALSAAAIFSPLMPLSEQMPLLPVNDVHCPSSDHSDISTRFRTVVAIGISDITRLF
jgi:hypothetical protein